jgi:hypothetical protein
MSGAGKSCWVEDAELACHCPSELLEGWVGFKPRDDDQLWRFRSFFRIRGFARDAADYCKIELA